jgi:hypothetical protein
VISDVACDEIIRTGDAAGDAARHHHHRTQQRHATQRRGRMRKIILTFGLIAGGILAGLMVATVPFMDRIGNDLGMVIGYTTMVVAFMMVFFGIRSYRENVGNGLMSFGRGFQVGMGIALIACVCYVATWEVLSHTVMRDFADKYATAVIEKKRSSGASDDVIAATQAEMDRFREAYRNPLFRVPMTFAEVFPVGLLATLVSAAILRRRNPDGVPSPA